MEMENLDKPYYCDCHGILIKPKGRPRHFTDEERRKRKTDYMLQKEWFCLICNNGHNYTLAGKHKHLHTNKHFKNSLKLVQEETD